MSKRISVKQIVTLWVVTLILLGGLIIPPLSARAQVGLLNEPGQFQAASSFQVSQWIEAENGSISAPFQVAYGAIYQSSTTNPADGGKAVYSIDIPVSGPYILRGIVRAPGDPSNSFYVNFDGEPTDPAMIWDIVEYSSSFEERIVNWRGNGTWADQQYDPKVFQLSAGTHSLIVRGREENTYLDKIMVEWDPSVPKPTQEPTAVPETVFQVSQTIEAEDGKISAPFRVQNGALYQTSTTNPSQGGKAEYKIQIPEAGNYIIKAVVNASDDPNNSFYVNFDGEPTDPTMIWDVVKYTRGFEERTVTWRGNGTWADQQFDPKEFTLSAGTHTLILRGREASTYLDKFVVEKVATTAPTQIAPTATSVSPTTAPTSQPTSPPPSGAVNVAVNKTASQSSNYSDSYGVAYASRAVDGNNNGRYSNLSVSHTLSNAQAWWQVDLGAVQNISQISIWNRTDCCSVRLSNFYVLVSDSPISSTNLDSARAQSGVTAIYVSGQAGSPTTLNVNRSGRYVRVQLTGTNYLSLAEVQVWSDGQAAPQPTSTSVPPSQPVFQVSETIEAEQGTISGAFQVSSGAIYQSVTTNASQGGKATYQVNIPQSGQYIVNGIVRATSDPSNSFYINFDNEPTDPTMIWDIVDYTSGYESRTANWRGSGTYASPQSSPKVFDLTAGTHTLIVRGREANTYLDKLVVAPYSQSTSPTQPAPTATSVAPTPAPTQPVVSGAYYVATNGNDSNPGTIDRPWRTLAYASQKVRAGDTLYIRGGTYRESTSWSADGRSDAPITIKNYPGETVVIDGEDRIPAYVGGTWMFMVWGDWYVVEGLEVKRAFDEGGIGVRGAHVTIRNCYTHHNWGAGITMMGDYGLAEGNRVWYNGVGNEFGARSRGGWPAALTCARYPNHCTLRGNVSWENWGEGISTFEAYYTTIEDNISYNNQQNLYVSDTKYTVVQRNLVYCTPGNVVDPYTTQNGILVGDEKRNPASSDNKIINNIVYGCDRNLAIGTNESTNNLVANNTFVNTDGDANILMYSGSCTNCRFFNNIVLQEDSRSIASIAGSGWTFSNNLWSKSPPSVARGSNDVIGDPRLAKTGNPFTANWYKLLQDSPAISKGRTLSEIKSDFSGYGRSGSYDIGAFEYR